MMARRQILEALALVASTWTNWRLPEDRTEAEVVVKAWTRVLGHLDSRLVIAAIDSYVTEAGPFAPHQGMILRRAVELDARAAGRQLPDVDQAWAEIQSEISRVGWTVVLDAKRRPLFSHPSIQAAVDAMGWSTLCESENPMADRAHFLKLYGVATERATRDAVMPSSVRELMHGGVKALGDDLA